ncbi:MAG: hypothetical protein K0R58_215 [Ramlibacter sp.]|jgi:hypothetical protein|nr:hypothetical protein [Ramlibacter sp.]
MRFSAVFQLPLSLPRAAQPAERGQVDAPVIEPAAPAAAAPEPSRWPHDLPEDLDARVRLVGEWQFGEG